MELLLLLLRADGLSLLLVTEASSSPCSHPTDALKHFSLLIALMQRRMSDLML
jgi:hypothetical protein